jgi:hypothetical protein
MAFSSSVFLWAQYSTIILYYTIVPGNFHGFFLNGKENLPDGNPFPSGKCNKASFLFGEHTFLPEFGRDVSVALVVVGQQAVGAVLPAIPHHKGAAALGGAVQGAVAEEAVEVLLPHIVVAGEVLALPVLEPGKMSSFQVHGVSSFYI